jgi:hypothetical protein
VEERFSKVSLLLGWIWEIVSVLTVFWMKQAKSSWNQGCPPPQKDLVVFNLTGSLTNVVSNGSGGHDFRLFGK